MCGALKNLEVLHILSRSLLGDDSEDNLITPCTACHRKVHRPKLLGILLFSAYTLSESCSHSVHWNSSSLSSEDYSDCRNKPDAFGP